MIGRGDWDTGAKFTFNSIHSQKICKSVKLLKKNFCLELGGPCTRGHLDFGAQPAHPIAMPLTSNYPKTFNKTVSGYIFYHTSKILQTRKLEKSILSMLFLKHLRCEKITLDGNVFETFITLSTKHFCLMLAVHLGLNSLYLSP